MYQQEKGVWYTKEKKIMQNLPEYLFTTTPFDSSFYQIQITYIFSLNDSKFWQVFFSFHSDFYGHSLGTTYCKHCMQQNFGFSCSRFNVISKTLWLVMHEWFQRRLFCYISLNISISFPHNLLYFCVFHDVLREMKTHMGASLELVVEKPGQIHRLTLVEV